MSKSSDIDDAIEALERLRDELLLKIHLAAADARSEWDELEQKWSQLRVKASAIGRVAEETAVDVGEAVDLLGKELKKGYERLRRVI